MEISSYRKEGKGRYLPYLGPLAYCWYNAGMPMEDFLRYAREMTSGLSNNKLEVDHADNNFHNHCSWNLMLTTKSENSRKHNWVRRVERPKYAIPSVDESATYLVECGYAVEEDGILFRYYVWCQTANDLTSLLKFLNSVDSVQELECLGSPIIVPLEPDAVPWTEGTDYFLF